MGIYAGLGLSQAVAAFLMGAAFALLTYFASQTMHKVCSLVFIIVLCSRKVVGCGQSGHARSDVVLRDNSPRSNHEQIFQGY
jgi:hypothetical protein